MTKDITGNGDAIQTCSRKTRDAISIIPFYTFLYGTQFVSSEIQESVLPWVFTFSSWSVSFIIVCLRRIDNFLFCKRWIIKCLVNYFPKVFKYNRRLIVWLVLSRKMIWLLIPAMFIRAKNIVSGHLQLILATEYSPWTCQPHQRHLLWNYSM